MASKKKKIEQVTPDAIPEVSDFLGAVGRLEAFRTQHADVFKQLDGLVEEYNQKLEAADQAVRSQQVSCAPFELYQYSTTYNAKTLYDLVGHDRFFLVGGQSHTETVYDVDKAKLEVAIEQGKIPADTVDSFRTISPRYHAPKKLAT